MIKHKLITLLAKKFKTDLVKNSFWGVLSNVIQNILFSVFFIVVARKYNTAEFAGYILANTLYGFVVAFSSLGLGQWFVRELVVIENKTELISRFFKVQLLVGIFFYGVNVLLSYTLYHNDLIRHLSLLIGINVVFDNVIYVITFVNIAQLEQKKTFIILTVEAVLKFLVACILFVVDVPIIYLAFILIILRFTTLNLFIRIGSSNLVNLRQIIKVKVDIAEIKKIISANWPFIVIGSISVLYWRIGNILVSKTLTLADVANYEISFKLFSMAQILPFIVSTSIFPMLIKRYNSSMSNAVMLYKKAFVVYTVYGLLAYTFIYSFSDFIIPFLFGKKYLLTPVYCKEMFLTILVFPTALLQANLLISMKLEKMDMRFNILSLLINISICIVGLYYYKSLSVVNYAIFLSFLVFHIAQDLVLLKRKVTNKNHVLVFYLVSGLVILAYQSLVMRFNKHYTFFLFWTLLAVFGGLVYLRFYHRRGLA